MNKVVHVELSNQDGPIRQVVLEAVPTPIPGGVRWCALVNPEIHPSVTSISEVSWVEPDEDTVRSEITKCLVNLHRLPTSPGPTGPGTLSEADHCFVSVCLLPPGFPIFWEDVARIQTLWKVATTPVAGEMVQAPKLGLATIDGEVRLVPQVGETLTVPSSAGHVYNGTDETK